jgi:MOSC domain-containing protein YiiM
MLDERASASDASHEQASGARVGVIVAVSRGATHNFSKTNEAAIQLVAGLGVVGDAHLGETVQHVVRVTEDPNRPNLRQVHLIHAELFEELRAQGFAILPGQIGENVTTRGIDLLGLPKGTLLHAGDTAVVEVTGLRNPCRQLDRFQDGLMAALMNRDADGNPMRKSGIMGIVLRGGDVRPGDSIRAELPPEPHQPLDRV